MSFIPSGYLYRDVPKTLIENDRRLARITKEFRAYIGDHQSQLARQLDLRSQTVSLWFKQGRVSPWGAIAIGKLMPEWPRERLRPDILEWAHYENSVPGTRKRSR